MPAPRGASDQLRLSVAKEPCGADAMNLRLLSCPQPAEALGCAEVASEEAAAQLSHAAETQIRTHDGCRVSNVLARVGLPCMQ